MVVSFDCRKKYGIWRIIPLPAAADKGLEKEAGKNAECRMQNAEGGN
jgi:hypothetical protein